MGQGPFSWIPIWNFGDARPWEQVRAMVLEYAIVGGLVGIALGLRYKVLILVPTVALTTIFAIAIGVAHSDRISSIVVAAVMLGTAVQVGYVVGILMRAAIRSV